MNGVNVHGIRIFGRARVGGERGEWLALSFFESYDTGFLLVEVDGLFHPSFESGGNFFHGVDHGGKLDI